MFKSAFEYSLIHPIAAHNWTEWVIKLLALYFMRDKVSQMHSFDYKLWLYSYRTIFMLSTQFMHTCFAGCCSLMHTRSSSVDWISFKICDRAHYKYTMFYDIIHFVLTICFFARLSLPCVPILILLGQKTVSGIRIV